MVGDEVLENGVKLLSEPVPPSSGKNIQIALADLTVQNIGQLRQLNGVILPVVYSEKFYKDALEVGEFAKLAYCNDVCVGGVCCRLDIVSKETGEVGKLYIMSLVVLAPYRKYGIGSYLLDHILYHSALSHTSKPDPETETRVVPIVEMLLHVQTSNKEASDWYEKRGFEIVGEVKDYYRRIKPSDAWLLKKVVQPAKSSS